MADDSVKGEGKRVAQRRPRGLAKPVVPAKTLATKPVLPVTPPPVPEVPAALANPTPPAPTPVAVKPVAPKPQPAPVVASEPVKASKPVEAPAAAPGPVSESTPAPAPAAREVDTPRPAAPAASFDQKEVTMNETVTSFAEKAQDQAKTAFANVGEQARTAAEKSRKVAEDMAELGKGNVEAMIESARIAAEGFQTMSQDAANFARTRYDSTAAMFQTIASVKSPSELMQIQAEYVRSAFDAMVKEASRSTEATLKLAGDVAKPLQNRMAVAADKIRAVA